MPKLVNRVWTKYSWWLGVIMTGLGALPQADQLTLFAMLGIPPERQIAVLGVVLILIRSVQQKPKSAE